MKQIWGEMVPPAKYRIEFDPAKCWWCRSCELICSLYHEGVCAPTLSRIHVSINPFQEDVTVDVCRQCRWPVCMFACPVEGAIVVDEDTGARIIIEEKCVGCGKCAEECPFNSENLIIRLNPRKHVYVKCDLCGGKPQCVDICPTGALKYVKVREEAYG